MKILYTGLKKLKLSLPLFVIFFIYFPSIGFSDIILDENFTSGNLPVGWTNNIIQGSQGWTFANSPVFGSPSGGYYMVFDDEILGAAVIPNEAAMESPIFDFSNRTNVMLKYSHHWFGVEFTNGYVEISNDGGTTWVVLSTYELVTQGSLATPTTETIDVTAYAANQATVQVRFRYSDGSQAGKFWYLDDIRMYSDPDVGVSNLVVADYLGCAETYSSTETITVGIKNYSVDAITNIPLTCIVSGGTSVTLTGTYVGPPILEGQIGNFTFSSAINMSADAVYHFQSFTTLATDSYIINDTLLTGRRQYVQAYPDLEQFDYSDAGWREYGGTSLRKFSHGETPYLSGPEGNGKSWYIDVTGDLWQSCYVESPVYDLSSATNPTLTLDAKFNLAGHPAWQYVKMEYSINDGVTWSLLGSSNDLEWYNQSSYYWYGNQPTWQHYQKTLCNLIGESCVKFRFHARNGVGGASAQFAFDNFQIIDSIDVGIVNFIEPYNDGCLFSENQTVTVTVANWSCGVVTSIPVVTEIFGQISDTLMGTVPTIPADGTVAYTFPATFDMTGLGIYDFETYTDLLIDGNNDNDTSFLNIDVNQLKISSFPYAENFDTDDGLWKLRNETANRKWSWGAVPYLAGPNGNGNSWYLDYSGDLWQPVYIESPVFDFTENTRPILSMDVMYNLAGHPAWQYVRVEYSLDGGASWTILGNSNESNWYNQPSYYWYGNQSGWQSVQHELCQLSGEDCVKIRVHARCGQGAANAQFAFDNFIIDDGSTDDLEPILISNPDGGDCSYFATENIGVLVQNNTCRPLTNVPVVFTMSGPNSVTLYDTIPGPIPRFGRFYYVLQNTVDMSLAGTYNLSVTVNSNLSGTGLSYINDTNLANNTITEVRYANSINLFPDSNDFNSDNSGWAAYPLSLVNNNFNHGPLPYLNGAEGNGDSWYLDVSGDLWQSSYVESSIYDFSTVVNPVLHMDVKYQLTGHPAWQYVRVEYSTDGGGNWSILGNSTDPNWYNQPSYYFYGTQNSWKNVQHSLCNLIGESCVKFRMSARIGSANANAYFAFDNFEIIDGVDVSVNSYVAPIDLGCLYGQQQELIVEVYNWSCATVSNVPLTSDISGQLNQTITGVLSGPVPSEGSLLFTFPSVFDMTYTGTYNFNTYTEFPSDSFITNDSLALSFDVTQLKVTSFPYFEDFDTSSGYWIEDNETINRQWEWGQVPYLAGPVGNDDSWYLDFTGDLWQSVYVESPVYDLSAVTDPVLSMDVMYNLSGHPAWQYVRMEYSINGGNTWATLGSSNDPNWYNQPSYYWYGNQPTWVNVEKSLCSISGEECVKFRMAARCGSGGANAYFSFDNLMVTSGGNDDLQPILIFEPNGGKCSGYTSSESLGVLVQNNTCRPVTNLPINFNLTGANTQSFSETVPGPIPAFGKYYYTFSNTVDMSSSGDYTLEITTGTNPLGIGNDYINDTNLSNNIYSEIRHADAINTFPYLADFELTNEGWASAPLSGVNRVFLLDTVPYLNGDEGNGTSWFLDVTGDLWNTSWVESPVFDFSSVTNPILNFDAKFNLSGHPAWQYVRVEYTINGGTTWSILGSFNDPNWYNQTSYYWYGNNSNWTNYQHSLCNLIGENCVKFRIAARVGSAGVNAQFAFDNFEIIEGTDVGVTAFIDPVFDNCLYSDTQPVTVRLHNWSCSTVSGIPIVCEVSGANNVTLSTTYSGSILADGNADVTFPATFDMTDIGEYYFSSFTAVPSEVNLSNDSSFQNIYIDHLIIDTYDYYEDFNATSGFGSWNVINNTINRNWVYGSVPYLGGSQGHENSWYLEYTADLWQSVYLESPVYDFSSTSNPILSFEEKHNLSGHPAWQYVRVEYTINGGATWLNLGTSLDPDWYTQPSYYWYGNNPNWNLVQHDLCNLAGESCVKFRISARCGTGGVNAQFAFDNFHITDTPIDASIDVIAGCHGSEYSIDVDVFNRALPCTATPTITNLDLFYSIDNSAPISISYSGLNITAGNIETLAITGVIIPTENSSVKVWVNFPNGFDDQFFENDTVTMSALSWPNCNDHCSNAIQLGLGTTTASQTSFATIESNEDPTFSGCGSITIENTVWYSFTTTSSTDSVTVIVENQVCSPTTQGLQIVILEAIIPCDASTYTEIFCNAPNNVNNIQYGPVVLTPNTTYYIAIDGVAGNDCDFNMTLLGSVATIPEVQFSAPLSGVVDEDVSGGQYDMTLEIVEPNIDYPTKVDVILQSGDGSRLTSWTTQTVTFPAGSTLNQTLSIDIEDNLFCDGFENLTFVLGNAYVDDGGLGLQATIGLDDTHDLEIKDDETYTTPSFFEDFETGTSSFTPWESDDSDWLLNSSGGLNGTYDMIFVATSSSGSITTSHNKNLLSYDCMRGVNTTWRMNIDYPVEPTPSNQAILGLSEFGYPGKESGYRLVIGENSGTDVISILKIDEGAENPIPVFQANYDWLMTWDKVGIEVIRDDAGNWRVAIDNDGDFDNLIALTDSGVGTMNGFDDTYNFLGNVYFGLDYGDSASGRLSIDDIEIGIQGCGTTYYSQSTGFLGDPIWSQTPSGTAGTPFYNQYTDFVIQSGHEVTVQSDNCVSALGIESGATLTLDPLVDGLELGVAGNFNNLGTLNEGKSDVVMNGHQLQSMVGTAGATMDFHSLQIANDNGGVVSSNDYSVTHLVYPRMGILNLNGNVLNLPSSSAGTGGIYTMNYPTSDVTGGDIVLGRYIQADELIETAYPGGWVSLSSPVVGGTVADWDASLITTGFPGSQWPNYAYQATNILFNNIIHFDETNGTWVGATGLGDILGTNTGYFMYMQQYEQSTTLTGDFNHGDSPTNLEFANSGWNLVSNPYPCEIDWRLLFAESSNVSPTVYIYDSDYSVYRSYNAITESGSTSPLIASSQSFWVSATSAAGILNFTEEVKTYEADTMVYQRDNAMSDLLVLQIDNGVNINESFLAFSDEATHNFDANYDSPNMAIPMPMYNVAYVSSMSQDDVNLDYNFYGLLNESTIVPVWVDIYFAGEFEFSINGLTEEITTGCIYLEDVVTGDFTQVTENFIYPFDNDVFSGVRFNLHFSGEIQTEIENVSCQGLSDGSVSVQAPGNGPFTYTWHDENDTQIAEEVNTNGSSEMIDLPFGNYVIEVTTENELCATQSIVVYVDEPSQANVEIYSTPDYCDVSMDGEIVIDVQNTLVYEYQLIDENGVEIASAVAANYSSVFVESGVYSVIVVANCDTTTTLVNLVDPTEPIVSIVDPITDYSMLDSTTIFMEGSYVNVAYDSWIVNNVLISNEAELEYTINVPGAYEITLLGWNDESNCYGADTTIITVVGQVTDIGELSLFDISVIRVFDGIEIDLQKVIAKKGKLEIINSLGQLVLEEALPAETGKSFHDLSKLSRGIYFVNVTNGDEILYQGKVVWMDH